MSRQKKRNSSEENNLEQEIKLEKVYKTEEELNNYRRILAKTFQKDGQ